MAAEESKDLKKYFENDPPSFFDDLAAKEGDIETKFKFILHKNLQKIPIE